MQITLNEEQQLYVKHFGQGVTAWGFKNAFEETRLLAVRLGQPDLAPYQAEFGTLDLIEKHSKLIEIASRTNTLGTWFSEETPAVVQKFIERLRHTEETVRVFYGDPKTGLSSMDEFDMIGQIGRSTGVLKVPLLITEGDGYGANLSDSRVIRVIRASDGKNLYRHPGFHLPKMEIVENEHPKFAASVMVADAVAARFRTYAKAAHWVAFMAGETVKQPG